ncbi:MULTISPECIES: elongation factor P-like protein YeiP [unclassified Vibrio]|uniref:Elongation factor P-like protein n=1 Tax=Vibrio sp. HB236076 TaxID=3232307 RepID=A0AB39HCL3_9VIBR|nr:elongation factor P-like protein YeiP [Vibrio sp. HB161653]MDP5253539.1 elongation factor P-like protein YeiP [Vibrio sp. HB161653]
MPKVSDIKKGFAVEYNGKILLVKDIEVTKPSARGASTIYRFRFTDLATGGKVDERFKADEQLDTVEMFKRAASFSYIDGDDYIFMDNEDYSQYSFKKDDIEEELLFINEEIQGLQVVLINGEAAAIDLPASVELVIEETDPSIKGASASARTKPARFATGLVVQVPEYIATGDRIIVNTAERKYMSRA